MEQLSNELLIQAYHQACRLKLDEDFINLIYQELKRRGYTDGQINESSEDPSFGCEISLFDQRESQMAEDVSEIIELISSGQSMTYTLEFIIKSLERYCQPVEAFGSILLYNNETDTLGNMISPSMPNEFMKNVPTIMVGPYEGSCGAAAFFKRLVKVKDISINPIWENNRENILKYGFVACSSIPILSTRNELLGTFALYFKEKYTPNEDILKKFETAARLAAIAIEMGKIYGKNVNRVTEPNPLQHIKEIHEKELQLHEQLKQALKREEFVLFYQPYFDMNRNKCGMEALLRWNHPNVGILSPISFLDVAEKTGFILELEKWVLKEAVQTIKQLEYEGYHDVFISVNISAQQFENKEFPKSLSNLFKKYKLNPEKLKLEVTERFLINRDNIDVLFGLKELGLKISIDDFGTSYSSLQYLQDLPIDELKIDRSFITDMEDDFNKQKIVEMIIMLAKQLKLNVVAEGVETEDQLHLLKQMNCDFAQGYLFSKPIPLEDIKKKFFPAV